MLNPESKNPTQFLLEDEIKYIVEGLTVSLNEGTSMKLKNDDRLPYCVVGDVQSLRLALVTLIEFGMKYCHEGQISINSNHEGCTPENRNVIKFGFYLTLEENEKYNDKIIYELLTMTKTQGRDELVKRFIAFYDLIDHFGLGMVFFPSIIKNLGGTLKVKYVTMQ